MNSNLTGGLKNAIDRGEAIEKAKQSFINAGYSREEVEESARQLSPHQNPAQQNPPHQTQTNQHLPNITKPLPLQKKTSVPIQQKSFPRWLIILIITLSAIVIIGAALLGLYWDRLFLP